RARQRDCEREASPLARRQATVDDTGEGHQAEALQDGVGLGTVAAGGPGGEPEVLAHGEVVVAEGLVADERELAPYPAAVDSQVVAEHRLRARLPGHQPREQTEQCGLAGAVGPREQHDLPLARVEVDACERWEAAQEAHDGAETDDDGHTRLRAKDVASVRTTPEAGRTGAAAPPPTGAVRRPPPTQAAPNPAQATVSVSGHAEGARRDGTHPRGRGR